MSGLKREEHIQSLSQRIIPVLEPLGYELIHLDVQFSHQKKLRVFIDSLEAPSKRVSIQDCVQVTRALESLLETDASLLSLFNDSYELEVSSPGTHRPLRSIEEYKRFCGQRVQITVQRPLTVDELQNLPYYEAYPRQKYFVGQLKDVTHNQEIILSVELKTRKQKKASAVSEAQIFIPYHLITKANLEPNLDLLYHRKGA